MFQQVRTRTVVQSIWLVEGIQERQKKQNKYKNNIIYFVLFISVSPTGRLTKTARIGRTGNNCLLQDFVLFCVCVCVCVSVCVCVCQTEGTYTASSACVYIYVCVPYLTADEPTKYTSLISCNYKFPQFFITQF
jgi:hypothetical protein